MKVWVYINNSREVGDVDHLKVFANEDAAEKRFEENEPEGLAFMYDVPQPKITNLRPKRKRKTTVGRAVRKARVGHEG